MSKPGEPSAPPPPERAGHGGSWKLFRALALDAGWLDLDAVVLQARATGMSLAEVHSLVRAMGATIASLPAPEREVMSQQIRHAQHQAALLVLDRTPAGPLSSFEREALVTAADLLLASELPAQAAPVFERVGDDQRAAQAWGAAGELERMEACLVREQGVQNARRDRLKATERFEALLHAGQRLAAVDWLAEVEGEAQELRALAADVERRLCPGRRLALRVPDGSILHFAGLPAAMGREGGCQVLLRDLGVSRQHARLSFEDSRFFVEDAGSRAGTGLGGMRLVGRVPLPPEGELSLGGRCRFSFHVHDTDRIELVGVDGLDRGMRIWLGPGALPVALPGAEGLRVVPLERSARIDVGAPVRLNGKLVGSGIDVLHGDVIETGALRLEVA